MWGDPWFVADALRRAVAGRLDLAGYGPQGAPWQSVAAWPAARLRRYGLAEGGPPVLIVPAPIKDASIWDLVPRASVVRRLIEAQLPVFLLEWLEDGDPGRFAVPTIERAVASCGGAVVLVGHSLGGTLAAIFAAARPERVRGLVLAEAPLAFTPRSGRLATAARLAPNGAAWLGHGRVPGSLLTVQAILSMPDEFVWYCRLDGLAAAGDRDAANLHLRVMRWSYAEFAMSSRLYRCILGELLRKDAFACGRLRIDGRLVRPADIACPVLAMIDPHSALVPPAAVLPPLAATRGRVELLRYGGDVGVALRHVGVLVGASAHRTLWPRAARWIAGL